MLETIALGTAVATVLGLGVKIQQLRNERSKIRLDAYPKRLAIFKGTDEFLNRAWHGNYVSPTELLAQFDLCKQEAPYLFDTKLSGFLDGLYEGVDRHLHLEAKLEIQGDSLKSEEKRALQEKVFSSRHWLGQQNGLLTERFKKHLDISAIG